MDVVTLSQANADAKRRYSKRRSLITTRSCHPSAAPSGNPRAVTYRGEQYAAFALSDIQAGFANWGSLSSGETPWQNAIKVKAAVQLLPSSGSLVETTTGMPTYPLLFGGRDEVWLPSGGFALSDALPLAIPAGRYFIKCYVSASANAAPSAPTLAAANAGSLAAGTHYVSLTYVYPNGEETSGGATASVATTGSNGSITITAPTNPGNGAVGWKVYTAFSSVVQYATAAGVLPFGTSYSLTVEMASDSIVQASSPRVFGGQAATYPAGLPMLGTDATTSGATNGDGYISVNADATIGGIITVYPGGKPPAFGPIVVLGTAADGRVRPSLAIMGDSIPSATGDYGFAAGTAWGGFLVRAALNQITNRTYSLTAVPNMGIAWLSTGGETAAQAADARGIRRSTVAGYATTVACTYGTNDLSPGTTASVIASYLLIIAARMTGRGQKFIQTTITPRATSTDGYATTANQSVTTLLEAYRRQLNAWILRTAGQAAIAGEAMAGGYAAALTPAVNLYGGGNGTATSFVTRNIFVQGTEAITVAGAAKVLTTDYTYLGAVTIGGVAYASGVLFGSAPGNGAAVLASYTAAAGFRVLAGSLSDVWDTAGAVEIDAAGNPGTGGGWWLLKGNVQVSSTSTGANGTNALNDTTKTWAVNQWNGWDLVITSDPGNPSAVGQVRTIVSNTATALTFAGTGWAFTPSSSATYDICDSSSADGTHPTTNRHQKMAAAADLSKVA